MSLKKTALFPAHQKLNAKLVPYAGYEMPVSYTSLKAEHLAVRNAAGLFDVSHMGEFIVEGSGAFDLVQYLTSNDVSKLSIGKAQYSCLPNKQGGIVDDLLVYQLEEQTYMLVVNAANIEKDWNWITQHNQSGAKLTNVSDEWSLLALQGPAATTILQPLTDTNLDEIPFYHFTEGAVAGVSQVIISATGYTGSGGFELYIKNEGALRIWDSIMESGSPHDLLPAGLGARDTLRLEMGYCLYGNDISDITSPLEAGLGWITKFQKDFIGKSILKTQKEQGISRKLVGIRLLDKGIPRSGYNILNEAGKSIGMFTSGTMSPSLNTGIGLGYLTRDYALMGTQVLAEIRDKKIAAEVVDLPFYKA